MACTGADGILCNGYGIVVPCGPEPTHNNDLPAVVYNGPIVMSDTGADVSWRGEEVARIPGDTVQFLVMAKAYHKLYQYQEEPDIPAGDTGTTKITFPVDIAVMYKISVRRYREGEVGDWNHQYVFYGGADFTYLIDADGAYIVQDDDDTIYLTVENIPAPDNWAYNPDGTIMLDPDGNPVEKQ